LLNLVEEPFDQVACPIEIGAKADRVFPISFRRNVRSCSLLASLLPDPVGVIATIREQHRMGKQGAEEDRTQPVVVRLTGSESEMDRQTIAVHDRVHLAAQTSS
jgi:hypothetical protein